MSRVEICIEMNDEVYQSFEAEARREGVTVRSLLERMVSRMLRDMEREEAAGTDNPVIAS